MRWTLFGRVYRSAAHGRVRGVSLQAAAGDHGGGLLGPYAAEVHRYAEKLAQRAAGQVSGKIGLDYCDKLFHLERGYADQKLSFQQRYQTRLEQSKPVAGKFFAWAKAEYEKNPVPKSMLGAALIYAVNQESWLMNVFLDGRLELSNDRAEWAVRPFAVGRKNWLFSNTPKGADASAAIYSIVETAKANGLRPSYTSDTFWNACLAEACLPWVSTVQHLCK